MLNLGQVLNDRYRIDRMQEMGALEATYRGLDLETNTSVLIREILPQPDLEPEALEALEAAFVREAEALTQLRHPHIVSVRDYFTVTRPPDGGAAPLPHAYLVTDQPKGQPLVALLERDTRLREARVIPWTLQLLDALDYCHRHQVLHRDVQPHNIIITPDDQAMLTHFEVTGLWDAHDPRTWTAKRVMGTPQYAPPERWGMRVRQVDVTSDLYSLGATLYHALTGEEPLTADERTSNPYRFLQVKSLTRRVSDPTRAVIMKAMELPQHKRYQTAEAMAEALKRRGPQYDVEIQPAPFSPQRHQRSSGLDLRVVGIAAAVVVILGLIGLVITQTGIPSMALPFQNTETPSPSPSPGASPEGSPTAGTTAVASPTAAQQLTPTRPPTPTAPAARAPTDWGVVVTDGFEDNANGWIESETSDDWGRVSRAVVDGVYRWEIAANQAVGRWWTPDLAEGEGVVGDFYLAVDAQRLAGPEQAAYGLICRESGESYYVFNVRDDGYYQFSLWDDFAWQPVIDWTQTEAVRAGEVNRLSVIARGGTFELYINDAFVATAENAQLSEGETGLSISTAATEGTAVFVFDNYELRTPSQNPDAGPAE